MNASDPVLAELQVAWSIEDQLRPDAPAGPRHTDRTYDLTLSGLAGIERTRVQCALWKLFRGLKGGNG